jgi:hypothetical protein
MNRREMLQRTAVLFGGTLIGADGLFAKNVNWDALEYGPDAKGIGLFDKKQVRLLNEIADTIIPTTDTPGAKAAKVGQFMAVMVSDCYEPEEQKRFMEGLVTLQAACEKSQGKTFLKCTAEQRAALLNALDKEQQEHQKSKKSGEPTHYFRVIKDLALWGYFSSEIGATQALRHVEIPGRYETIEYKKGDRAWG